MKHDGKKVNLMRNKKEKVLEEEENKHIGIIEGDPVYNTLSEHICNTNNKEYSPISA
jgi:hypothetical protein